MSIELWNGFCAGMSLADVKNRGAELFGIGCSEEAGLSTATKYYNEFPNEYSDDCAPQEWFIKVKPDTVITYGYDNFKKVPECLRDPNNVENEKIFNEKYKFVKMFFYENILFALLINWSGDSEKVLEFAISKYGKYDKDYCWDITDKYMYIKETIVFFIEKNFYEKFIEIAETKEKMRRNEIEQEINEKKRIANEGILF